MILCSFIVNIFSCKGNPDNRIFVGVFSGIINSLSAPIDTCNDLQSFTIDVWHVFRSQHGLTVVLQKCASLDTSTWQRLFAKLFKNEREYGCVVTYSNVNSKMYLFPLICVLAYLWLGRYTAVTSLFNYLCTQSDRVGVLHSRPVKCNK